ncbi:MAG: hypothetical protein KME27_10520 [Lyngbya sp. HA4199-MV5]|jgi:hypothetical protein|nr:hypothetical protein [Lyngbya sp. HA4199-MV5]
MAPRKPVALDPSTGRHQNLQAGDTLTTPDSLPYLTTDAQFLLVEGLECSQNGSNPQYVDLTAGKAAIDVQGVRYTVTSAAFTKRLNAAWAIGTNAGGLLTGSSFPASTTLHCYVMRRRSNGVVDHGFHTSATQTTFTDGSSNVWDLRLHMSLLTDATQMVPIDQNGNEVTFRTPYSDVSTGIPTTATLYTLSVPTGIALKAKLDVFWGRQSSTGNLYFWLSDPASPDLTITTSVFNGYSSAFATTPAAFITASVPYVVGTNTSAQVRCKANAVSGVNTQLLTRGYFHPRGGNPTVAQTVVLNNGFTYVGYYAGNAPGSPSTGATWRELDSSGLPLMDWYWDGSTWKSLAIFKASWGSTSTGISANSIYYDGIPLNNNYDIYAEAASILLNSSSLTSTAYWTAQFSYITKNTSTVNNLGSAVSNQSGTNSVFALSTVTLNTLITFANFGLFRLNITKVSTPGNLIYAAAVSYRYSRP